MIATKFIFCKFRHALSPDQKATKQTNFYAFKKAKCYPEVLLDQDDCRVNFKVSVNLAKNLLVNLDLSPKRLNFIVNFHAAKFSRQI